jgi:cellulose synthase/poly-beta-1,6-N-acetylglucosamine synthase-like glycosyltransferase
MTDTITIVVVFAFLLSLHSWLTLYVTLYARFDASYKKSVRRPESRLVPKATFTVLIPCRHEEKVISETIERLARVTYPKNLTEIIVLCTPDDMATIEAAESTIKRLKMKHARVVMFDPPAGKPRALNIGLRLAKHKYIAVFDAEDDVGLEVFSAVDSIVSDPSVDVVQGGVRLINHTSRWYGIHNAVEYFLWYKHKMHYFNQVGVVPLGGNTVFFKKSALKEISGWDEAILTEDADVGIRLSAAMKNVRILYDPSQNTNEETPNSLGTFIRQRTRWSQGFLQIIAGKKIHELRTAKQKLLVYFLLTSPMFIATSLLASAALGVYLAASSVSAVALLPMLTPLILVLLIIWVNCVGLHEYGQEQKEKIKLSTYMFFIITFLPYQALLSFAAIRAMARHTIGLSNWEKTPHQGLHRMRKRS